MPDREPDPSEDDLSRLVRRVGPTAASLACERALLLDVQARIDTGASPADAVFGALFSRANTLPKLGLEVLAAVVVDLTAPRQVGQVGFASRSDLVQSVLGDLCADLSGLEYRTQPQFLALVLQRIRWKQRDHLRRCDRDRRREDLRVAEPLVLESTGAESPSPATHTSNREEAARIAVAIQSLPERDRRILRLVLRGLPSEAIASGVGLRPAAYRKALERARARLRERLGTSPTPR